LAAQRLIMHGSKFDLLMLGAGTDTEAGADLSSALAWDTMLASRDLDPNQDADLAQLEARWGANGYLTLKRREDWTATKQARGKLNTLSWEQARQYAATDAEVTFAVFEEQAARYEAGEGSRAALRSDIELSSALLRLERRGIGYDVEGSRATAAAIARAEGSIGKVLPFRATVNQAKRYYFGTLGMEPRETTATGQPRLDDVELSRLVQAGAPFAEEWQRLTKLKHARTAWYEPYAEMCGWDGRLRTVYSLAKVISGRLSSTRVNLQAIPHEYQLAEVLELGLPQPRELFRARPGARLWELDLSQAELRVAAVEAQCLPMLDLIEQGADIHGAVAEQLFGSRPGDATWDKDRSVGKRADFSFIFGVGAEEFQRALHKYSGIWLLIRECNRIVHRWRRLYPEYGRTIRKYMERANHHGYVRLANGRVRHFASWEEQHKAFNQYVQGSLAELMKDWLLESERRFPEAVLLTIHDSLVLEVANTKAGRAIVAECQALGARMGTQLFGVPMEVDVKPWHSA
jgi:DNA polymerase-1